MDTPRTIVVGITGASGALYAQRLLHVATAAGCQIHLVVSPLGQRLLHDELGVEGLNIESLMQGFDTSHITLHNYRDTGALIASGSFRHDGMVIVPCSTNSLSAIATASAQNLLHRAAYVTLKERRRLVLVHREMPITLVDARHMQTVMECGGIICPANPGFYMLPRTIEELVDFVVGRVLDLLDVPHDLNVRWGSSQANRKRVDA